MLLKVTKSFNTLVRILTSSNGTTINSVSSTNATPSGWATACLGTATGCIGYHTTDAILKVISLVLHRRTPMHLYIPIHKKLSIVQFQSIVQRMFVSGDGN